MQFVCADGNRQLLLNQLGGNKAVELAFHRGDEDL